MPLDRPALEPIHRGLTAAEWTRLPTCDGGHDRCFMDFAGVKTVKPTDAGPVAQPLQPAGYRLLLVPAFCLLFWLAVAALLVWAL
jgi:hypothetical protein